MTLTYHLAKELDEAGFPRSGKGKLIGAPDSLVWRAADRVYAPTLCELIVACGTSFATLQRHGEWQASDAAGIVLSGSSPEEAVARLWLALHGKHGLAALAIGVDHH
jgi:hypothetical protein